MKNQTTNMKAKIKVVSVTKRLVDSLLAKNERNRPINANRVASLVRAIKSGKWVNNGSTITLDGDGYIMDGQHRLTAIKEAGYPSDIELIIVQYPVFGNERDSVFYTMNTSRASSTGQVFQYNEVPNSSRAKATCRFISMLYYGIGFAGVPNNYELWDVYNLFKEEVVKAVSFNSKCSIVRFLSPMMAAFAIAAHRKENADKVWELARKVTYGEKLRLKSVEHSLFRYCTTLKTGHVSTNDQKTQLLIALNAIYTYIDSPEKSINHLRPNGKREEYLLKRATADALCK